MFIFNDYNSENISRVGRIINTARRKRKNLKFKKKCKNLKLKLTNGEWWSNDRIRRWINGGFYGNLNGTFHGNHLCRNRKIAFSVDLEVDNKEEKSTLPLPSHYQLFKNSSPVPILPTTFCVVLVSVNLPGYVSLTMFLKKCLCV
ncbi:hypothetical protein AVEN_209710-1 [Araneus ventricosus]|uniref:Uncharacterized protein n=1 Tax=Araneus ventricosus TaxID=182803 RepID=A0A4Y2BWP1_ARAVE|nr:hypothetical protein AVEN_3484-1 [Araneus ventricosus]GBL95972.1 hypothetical protein AVEN_10170-1 [Araneus ventricosus]GBL95983.1 hypothetical protein AVEN_136767-1 [Araneus ventricosus]GBL96007.1 hypothetical protein AVEN_209710-1 [Araneus ventricosus]